MASSHAKIPTKPKGFNAITASIAVPNISDAVAFYADTLGADLIDCLTIPGSKTAIYATIKVSGTTVVLNLDDTALPYGEPGHVTLHHYLNDIEEVFEKAIHNGAVVVSPITPAWWGDLTAVLVDPFGVRWSLAQRAEQLNSQERRQRLEALYSPPKVEEVPEQVGPGFEAGT